MIIFGFVLSFSGRKKSHRLGFQQLKFHCTNNLSCISYILWDQMLKFDIWWTLDSSTCLERVLNNRFLIRLAPVGRGSGICHAEVNSNWESWLNGCSYGNEKKLCKVRNFDKLCADTRSHTADFWLGESQEDLGIWQNLLEMTVSGQTKLG